MCSGQSNMHMEVIGRKAMPTYGGLDAVVKSKNSNIRLFTVHSFGALEPLDDFVDFESWEEASPESVAEFSAVAYFFGKQLQEILDVPVGLIHSSWGSSIVEAWTSKEALSKHKEINLENM